MYNKNVNKVYGRKMEEKNNKEIFQLKFSRGPDAPFYSDAIPFELKGETYYAAHALRGYGGATIVFREEELIRKDGSVGVPYMRIRSQGIDFPKMFIAYTESKNPEYQRDVKSIEPKKLIEGIKNNPEEFLADYNKSFEEYKRNGPIEQGLFPVKTIDTADKGVEKWEEEVFKKAGIDKGPDIDRDDSHLK